MAFEWPKIQKHEDNIEREAIDLVYENVVSYYGVEDLEEVTREQIKEVEAFCASMNERSPIFPGFIGVLYDWSNMAEERGEERLDSA